MGMKAIAYQKYGSADVLEVKEVRKPDIQSDRVLLRVRAASANPYDWHFMRGVPYIARLMATGLRRPKHSVLGTDVAGGGEAGGHAAARGSPGGGGLAFFWMGGLAGGRSGRPKKRGGGTRPPHLPRHAPP